MPTHLNIYVSKNKHMYIQIITCLINIYKYINIEREGLHVPLFAESTGQVNFLRQVFFYKTIFGNLICSSPHFFGLFCHGLSGQVWLYFRLIFEVIGVTNHFSGTIRSMQHLVQHSRALTRLEC